MIYTELYQCYPSNAKNIWQRTINNRVFTSAKGHRGLSRISEEIRENSQLLSGLLCDEGKKMPRCPRTKSSGSSDGSQRTRRLFYARSVSTPLFFCVRRVYITHTFGSSNTGVILRSQLGTTSVSNCLHKPLTVRR